MANYESGHHINVDNLDPLMSKIKLIGSQYAPAKESLKLDRIQNLYSEGKTFLEKVDDHFAGWKLAVDDRQEAFKSVKTIVSRIIGNLYGMDVKSSLIEDAKQLQAKINSSRLNKPKEKDIENDQNQDEKKHSVSQQSFNSVLKNFSTFLALMEKTSGYETNDPDLKIEALRIFRNQLQSTNNNMSESAAALTQIRIQRNLYFYAPETGLVDVALSVKNYIKGIFGPSHPTYLDVRKIRFRNIR